MGCCFSEMLKSFLDFQESTAKFLERLCLEGKEKKVENAFCSSSHRITETQFQNKACPIRSTVQVKFPLFYLNSLTMSLPTY